MQRMTFTFARAVPALALALVLGACSGDSGGGDSSGAAPDVLRELPTLALGDAASGQLAPEDVSSGDAAASIRNVSVAEAHALMTGDAPVVVLDVRTAREFAEGHIEGAVNIDVMSDTFIEDLASLDKDAAYLVHCRSGKRSAKATAAMREASFTSVAHMDAGMNGWSEADLPVKK